MQYNSPAPMSALAQFVGEACLAQGKYPGKRGFDLPLGNQLSDGWVNQGLLLCKARGPDCRLSSLIHQAFQVM